MSLLLGGGGANKQLAPGKGGVAGGKERSVG
jgi:hypothetical protein